MLDILSTFSSLSKISPFLGKKLSLPLGGSMVLGVETQKKIHSKYGWMGCMQYLNETLNILRNHIVMTTFPDFPIRFFSKTISK